MNIIALSEENIAAYSSFMDPDMAENIGRSHYRGLIARQEHLFMGGMIWQNRRAEDTLESSIEWFTVADKETADLLFAAYKEQVDKEGVKRSIITIPALYTWEDGQYGDDVTLKVMYCLQEKYRQAFEAWLEKNDFTEFMVLREAASDSPAVCGATAEIHFYRTV